MVEPSITIRFGRIEENVELKLKYKLKIPEEMRKVIYRRQPLWSDMKGWFIDASRLGLATGNVLIDKDTIWFSDEPTILLFDLRWFFKPASER